MSHEVRLELRARNNRLYHAIFEAHPNVNAFCKSHGFSASLVGGYLNLTESPWRYPRESTVAVPRKLAVRLATHFQMLPEDLFPQELYQGLTPPRVVAEVSSMQFLSLASAERIAALPPADVVELREQREAINTVLNTLSPKEQAVIRARFDLGEDGEDTLGTIAEKFSLSRERVRQIEGKALRKMREPSRARVLRGEAVVVEKPARRPW